MPGTWPGVPWAAVGLTLPCVCFRICEGVQMTGGMPKKLWFFYSPSVIPPYFLFSVLFSFSCPSPAYCYISKNMACFHCNISSEKRLTIQAVERRYVGGTEQ